MMQGASVRGQPAAASVAAELGRLGRDLLVLFKPGVMQLVLFTSLVALLLAPASLHPVLAIAVMVALALGAAAAAAINNWYDSDIDRVMARTRRRPTAAGRLAPEEALGIGIVLAGVAIAVMGLAVGWLAAALLAATIGFYVLVYTMWLKRRTPQNIVIGGAAGALPPVVAWVAATGGIDLLPVVLFAIVFLWTPPHFWALALYRAGDYGKVGVPMLPVVAGRTTTARQILLYAALTVAASVLPVAHGELGIAYGVAASLLGVRFLALGWKLWRSDSDVVANRLFRYSITYLFALFGAMLVDRALGAAIAAWW
ncbi:MAG: heme o synthase [Geminicoccaceae bacterium]|nr:heme o synthase [Geminicoccaceae bacterium]MDW8368896.1 heme o synthase [Geminicoccaceae bacterium]